MKTRKSVLKELLYCFCDLCEKNGIAYSLVGEPAGSLLTGGSLPSQYNRLAIALPYGQIKRIKKIADDDPECPYYLSDIMDTPDDERFSYSFADPGFRVLNLNIYDTHGDAPLSITIFELIRNDQDKIRRFNRILRYVNGDWWGIGDPINNLRSVKWRLSRRLKGREEFLAKLMAEREKAIGLSDWDAVCRENTVILRNNTIPGELLKDVETVSVDGHKVLISPILTEEKFLDNAYESMRIVSRFQFDLGTVPSGFFEREDIRRQIDNILDKRTKYIKKMEDIDDEMGIIRNTQRIYMMAVDSKDFEEHFTDERIDEITGYLDKGDLESAEKALMPYIVIKEKYESREIPFVPNQKLEPLVSRFLEITDH